MTKPILQQIHLEYSQFYQKLSASDKENLPDSQMQELLRDVHLFASGALDQIKKSRDSFLDPCNEGEKRALETKLKSWAVLTSDPSFPAFSLQHHKLLFNSLHSQLAHVKEGDSATLALVRMRSKQLSLIPIGGAASLPQTSLHPEPPFTPVYLDAYIERLDRQLSNPGCTVRRFCDFVNTYCKESEVHSFLSALAYKVAHLDLHWAPKKLCGLISQSEFFFWQTFAENASRETLREALCHLSPEQRAHLAVLCCFEYREGPYFLLKVLAEDSDQTVRRWVENLRSHRFPIKEVALAFAQEKPLSMPDCANLLATFEERFNGQIREAAGLLRALVANLIAFPHLKRDGDLALRKRYAASDTETDFFSPAFLGELDQNQAACQSRVSAVLGPHLGKTQELDYTDSELQSYFTRLGLYEIQGPAKVRQDCILNTLTDLNNLFSSGDKLAGSHMRDLLSYCEYTGMLLDQLKGIRDPGLYRSGLKATTFVLPTCGKDLSRLSWLPSLAENMSSLNPFGIAPNTAPIFVLDQSQPDLFEQNARYIESLNARFGTAIIPVSNSQILQFSRKIGIEKLIDTTGEGKLGYGGARNAAFFLAPVLKHYWENGSQPLQEIFSAPEPHLHEVFNRVVLEGKAVVQMGDDDLEYPFANFIFDLTEAEKRFGSSFVRYNISTGRMTTYIDGGVGAQVVDFDKLICSPYLLYGQTTWVKDWQTSSMGGTLRSPGLSLLPFPNEESYGFETAKLSIGPRHPMPHLAGRRFPSELLPLSKYTGIGQRISSFIPYLLQSVLVTELIDPSNKNGQTVLPWRAHEDGGEQIGTLKETFQQASSSPNVDFMRQKVLQNFCLMWDSDTIPVLSFPYYLDFICNQDIDATLLQHMRERPELTGQDHIELEKMRKSFEAIQKDVRLCITFHRSFVSKVKAISACEIKDAAFSLSVPALKGIIEEVRNEIQRESGMELRELPIANSIYLTLQTIAGGVFHEGVLDALRIKRSAL
ncbi:MAG: hypothetical protein JSS60_00390 [Verrucomicrobia bacterium]|nr:hypothetical protein [Verrucomicrobiota bacterium]